MLTITPWCGYQLRNVNAIPILFNYKANSLMIFKYIKLEGAVFDYIMKSMLYCSWIFCSIIACGLIQMAYE
jgi:hypothetical protein